MTINFSELDRLDQFNKQEWFDVARSLRPDLSDQELDAMWDEFIAEKKRRALQ